MKEPPQCRPQGVESPAHEVISTCPKALGRASCSKALPKHL